jgi:hypothetical protein
LHIDRSENRFATRPADHQIHHTFATTEHHSCEHIYAAPPHFPQQTGHAADPSLIPATVTPQFPWTPEIMAAFAAFLDSSSGNNMPASSTQSHTRKYFSHIITTTTSDLSASVIKELKSGFKNYIPLALCTHRACLNATRSTDTVDTEIAWNDRGEMRLKQKTMTAAKDYHITTDDFTEIRENFIRGMRKYLIMGEDTVPGGEPAIDCADVFAEFFSTIAVI